MKTLKEFRGVLWVQKIKVFTDHKNLIQKALGLTSDRVHRWRLLLEEYAPEIIHLAGDENVVADALSRLEKSETESERADIKSHDYCQAMACYMARVDQEIGHNESNYVRTVPYGTFYEETYDMGASDSDSRVADTTLVNVFANVNVATEDKIYPVTIEEIGEFQRSDPTLKPYFKWNFQIKYYHGKGLSGIKTSL